MIPNKVTDLNAFVPAKDFELSKRFYGDMGFALLWSKADIAQFQIGTFRFLLQNFHVEQHSSNFVMSLKVEDADAWWQHVESMKLKEKYGLYMVEAPKMQPWGIRVMYLTDPTGVLWHITDDKK